MKELKHDVIVYIGRFQCPHNGHIATINFALKTATKLIIVIGSHNSPRTIKNPFTAKEREEMIRSCFDVKTNKRIEFIYMEDNLYSDPTWVRKVDQAVLEVVAKFNLLRPLIGIIGYKKDNATAKYVNQFKQWDEIPTECINVGDGQPLNATKIRELIFTGHLAFVESAIPKSVFAKMGEFVKSEDFAKLKISYDKGIAYERLYENAPFHSTTFYTADPVVIQSGRVLLVKRKNEPGAGLWALPGGFVGPQETALDACIRELYEETGIKIPEKVLRGSMFCEKLFDHPERSMRARITKKYARTITVAFGFKLDDNAPLASVKSDNEETVDAWWFTFHDISTMRDQIFEDHADLISYFLARV